jgi:hypothetical protein
MFFSLYPNCVWMSTKTQHHHIKRTHKGSWVRLRHKGLSLALSSFACLHFCCLCVLMGIVVSSLYCCSLIVIVCHCHHSWKTWVVDHCFSLTFLSFSLFVFANVCFVFLQEGNDCHHVSQHLCHQNHLNSKLKELWLSWALLFYSLCLVFLKLYRPSAPITNMCTNFSHPITSCINLLHKNMSKFVLFFLFGMCFFIIFIHFFFLFSSLTLFLFFFAFSLSLCIFLFVHLSWL